MAGIAEELSQLVELQKQGVLTPEEFEQQKARLLRGGDAVAAPAPVMMASNRGVVIAAVALLVVVVALAGAYAGGLFGRSHTGSATPMVASKADTAAPGPTIPGPSATPEFGSVMDDAHRYSTGDAVPAATILAAFKADPVAAKAQYGHPINVSTTVLKISGSNDAMRIDSGDPNLRAFFDAIPGATFDRGLIGQRVVGSCQAPSYLNVDGEQMLTFDHCTVKAAN